MENGKTLQFKIAEICIKVETDSPVVLYKLKLLCQDFLTREKRCDIFMQIINRNTPRPEKKDSLSLKEISFGADRFGFFKDNGTFRVFYMTRKEKNFLEMGRIDLLRKKSIFYNSSSNNAVYGRDMLGSFLRLTLEIFFAQRRCFFVHACAVKKDNQGFVFIGPSSSGKTTLARLLKDWEVLSDDFVCIKNKDGACYVYATPWRSYCDAFVRVKRIFFIEKSKFIEFKRLDANRLLFEFSPHTFLNFPYREVADKIISSTTSVIERVPCYKMRFSLDKDGIKNGVCNLK